MTPVSRRGRPGAETKRKKKRKGKLNSLTCAKEKEKAKTPNPTMSLSKALPTIDKEDQRMRGTLKVATWSIAKDAKKKILLVSTTPPRPILTKETKPTTITYSMPIPMNGREKAGEAKIKDK